MIGQTISHYEVLELIGQGGMGEVYRARDTKLGRDVAIKVLPRDFAEDAERLARFEQEARTVGSLNHPGLVTVFELGRHEGAPYMVMELIEGETLRAKLGSGDAPGTGTRTGDSSPMVVRGHGLPQRKAIDYAVQIARGLGAAHDQGVVHRDLKPENILITRDGRARILDFGLAKLNADSPASSPTDATQAMKTEPGKVMGTVGYMSPEQVRGAETDHRTDIFSLGLLIYEMLAGQRAFQAETSVETMSAILNQDPPPLTASTGVRLSPAVDRIVRRCLEKEPQQRFQSASDLAYALDAMQEDSSTGVAAFEQTAPRGRPGWIPVVAGVVLAAALGLWIGRMLGGGAADGPAVNAYHVTPLTFELGSKSRPSLSPDGRSFVYHTSDGGDYDIILRRRGGETVVNLTATSPVHDWDPAYSPDGEQIAFSSDRDGGGIFVMGATGESVRRVTDFGFNARWSPDGQRLVFAEEAIHHPLSRTTTSGLWVADLQSGTTSRLEVNEDAVEPSWSPDGRWIAFWGLPKGSGDRVLFTVAATGGTAQRIFGDDSFSWNPVWEADSQGLVFSSDERGSMDLWRIGIDPSTGGPAGEAVQITSSTQWIAEPALAQDGQSLVCVARNRTSAMVRISIDGSTSEVLHASHRELQDLHPSPDGRFFAVSARDVSEDVFVVSADGKDWRRLTRDSYKDRQPFFGPEGDRIWFFSDRSGRYEIWNIRPDGSNLTQVTETTGDNVSSPRVSPDGQLVMILSPERGTSFLPTVSKTRIREMDWIPKTPDGEFFFGNGWTDDSQRVWGEDTGGGTWFYNLADQTFEETEDLVHYAGFLDNGIHVAGRSNQHYQILNLTTGERTNIRPVSEISGQHALSHDRQWIYVIEHYIDSNIWLLERVGQD